MNQETEMPKRPYNGNAGFTQSRFAQRLQRMLRTQTQTELGRRLGLSQPAISALLSGRSKSTRKGNLGRVAKALGLTPERAAQEMLQTTTNS